MVSAHPGLLNAPPAVGISPVPASLPRGLGHKTVWLVALALCLLWSYGTTLLSMADRWVHQAEYSHGFLVPVFAGVVLWHRRELRPKLPRPSGWGSAILLAAVVIRLFGAILGLEAIDALSLLPALAGIALLLGSWAALRWTWPAIGFLGFMLPLPFTLEMMLARPLRRLATLASTYCLQTLGLPALAEGNIIHIDDVQMGVIDACSGLGMLMTFFALATAVAIISQRRAADKLVIVASAIPIAVVANMARITATGVAYSCCDASAGAFLHDWAGWLMMPLALILLRLELLFLDQLLMEATQNSLLIWK